jgi:exosortase/archaeosortase family protein
VVALPLVLLWLVRPLPPVITHQLHYTLQMGTADFASWALQAVGLAVLHSGDVIEYAGRRFHVIETCSGLRIIQALLLGALLLAEFICRRWEERIAVILAAPAVGFLVNGIRVTTLVLSPWSDVAPVHSIQGLVMVFAGMLLLALLGRMVGWAVQRRPAAEQETPSSPAPPIVSQPSTGRARLLALAATIAALALLSFLSLEAKAPEGAMWRIQSVSRSLDDWQATPLEWDQRYHGSVKFADKLLMEYRRGSDRVELFIGLSDRRRRYQVGLSPKTRLPGTGWGVRERGWVELEPLPVPVERLIVVKDLKQALVYHWRLGAESIGREALRWLLAADLDPRAPASSLVSVRVSADIGLGGRNRAEVALGAFLEDFTPALLAAGPPGYRRGEEEETGRSR